MVQGLRLLIGVVAVSGLWVGLAPASYAETPARNLREWQAQIDAAVVNVTAMRVQKTTNGIEITLDTAPGQRLVIDATQFKAVGNQLIAEIANARLSDTANAAAFVVTNPSAEIRQVEVTPIAPDRLRLTVTGQTGLPSGEVTLKSGGLAYSLKPDARDSDEEVVVTGARPSPYLVPQASTATRTDTPLRDIPQSIQVIPQQVLREQQVVRFEEALRNTAGATVGGGNEGQGYFVGLRGFQGVPVLLDGFRQYGVDGGESIVETAGLSQIEVLRGPASILYGQIQPGGVLNLVSRQPTDKPFYSGEIQVGSRALVRPQIDFSGPLTANGNVRYRLIAVGSSQEPFRDFTTNFSRVFIAPSLALKINSKADLNLQFQYLSNRQPGDFGRIVAGNQVLRTPRSLVTGEPDDFTASNLITAGYTFEYRFNPDWKLRQGFRYIGRSFEQELTFAFSPELVDGQLLRNYGGFDVESASYSLQTNLIGNVRTGRVRHTLLFGVDLNRTTEQGFGSFDFSNPLPLDLSNPVYRLSPRPDFRRLPAFFDAENKANRLGLYLQDQITLLENLKLLVGFRYDRVSQTTDTQATDTTPASFTSQTLDAFSPRIGLVYQPISRLSLYASYSQSFNPNSGVSFEGGAFAPERGRGWEAGLKAELIRNRLFTTLAYFDISKQNVLTADPVNPFFSIATGAQRSRGFDIDLTGQILPGWNVIASYAYIDAKVTQDNTIPVGNQLNGVPRHSASLWTTYEIQSGRMRGLGLGAGLNFVGERFGDLENSYTLNSYVLVDAAIFYRRNNWRWAVNFKNLGNVDYESGVPFGSTRVPVGEPFTVIGSFSVQF
jgi:iron complex outermembrane recepter protein